ncbi:MAG: hypothetical protein ACK4XK_06870 [Casimicrobiaceae bacterium]
MFNVRIGVCIAGLLLTAVQLWQGQILNSISGAITAILVLFGFVFGWESIGDNDFVRAAGVLALFLGVAGVLSSSEAADWELQRAQSDALVPLLMAQGTCGNLLDSELHQATVACSMKGTFDQLAVTTSVAKTLHNPSPAISIADGLNDARSGTPKNACAVAFAAVYSKCAHSIYMPPESLKRLLKEATR